MTRIARLLRVAGMLLVFGALALGCVDETDSGASGDPSRVEVKIAWSGDSNVDLWLQIPGETVIWFFRPELAFCSYGGNVRGGSGRHEESIVCSLPEAGGYTVGAQNNEGTPVTVDREIRFVHADGSETTTVYTGAIVNPRDRRWFPPEIYTP